MNAEKQIEDTVKDNVEHLKEFIDENKWENFQNKAAALLEAAQQEGFIAGYRYAIALLEENLVRRNKD